MSQGRCDVWWRCDVWEEERTRVEATWAKAATGVRAIITMVSFQEIAKINPKQATTLMKRE
jgi:hypothetical protein